MARVEAGHARILAQVLDRGGIVDHCGRCGRPLETSSTLAVTLGDGTFAVLLGTPAPQEPMERLLNVGSEQVSVHRDAKSFLRHVLRPFVPLVREMVTAGTLPLSERLGWSDHNWHRCSALAFLAVRLAAKDGWDDLHLMAEDGTVGDALLGWFTPLQGEIFVRIATRMGAARERSLELDLEEFVVAGALMPGVTDALGAAAAQIGSTDENLFRYAIHAILASAYLEQGVHNPQISEWTRLFLLANGTIRGHRESHPELGAWEIAPRRARATLSAETLWAAVAAVRGESPGHALGLDLILSENGYPGLVEAALRSSLPHGFTPFDAASTMNAALDEADPEAVPATSESMARALASVDRPREIEPVLQHALKLTGGSPSRAAATLAGIAFALLDSGLPRLALDVLRGLGAGPSEDAERPIRALLHLATAEALSSLGTHQEASESAAVGISLGLAEPWRARAARVEAASLVANGRPDLAAELLESVARASTAGIEPAFAFAIVTTYVSLGETQLAQRAAHQTLEKLEQEVLSSLWTPRLRALAAAVDATQGNWDTARRGLRETEAHLHDDHVAELCALAWAELIAENPRDPAAVRMTPLLRRLEEASDRAASDGHTARRLALLRATAVLLEALRSPLAEGPWLNQAAERQRLGRTDPVDLAAIATHLYKRGAIDRGRRFMQLIPWALADQFGRVPDIDLVLLGTRPLGARLLELADTIARREDVPPEDLRLAGELQRDALGRARRLAGDAAADESVPAVTRVPDDALMRLAPTTGTVHVLEWVYIQPGVVIGLVTRITSEGVEMHGVERGSEVLVDSAPALLSRLRGWTPRRNGDPLDHAAWRAAQEWFRDVVDPAPGDHVVVIELSRFHGLPWHAIEGDWTTSYISGWTELLAVAARRPPTRIGLLQALTVADRADTYAELDRLRERVRTLARREGCALDVRHGRDATQPALNELLATTDILVLCCHGVIEGSGDSALVVADESGHSHDPPRSGTTFGWRDAQHLTSTPSLLLSAACSTGATRVGGLGERLGLYGALRFGGTASVVAPAWDAVAVDVVTMIGDVLDRHLAGVPLARAVKQVADEAALDVPQWRARVLAVEGDWR